MTVVVSVPLARALQAELPEPYLHRVGDVCGHFALSREKRQLRELLPVGIKNLDRFGPSHLLAIVDLSQVENRSLDPLSLRRADLFDDAPIVMILPVFEAMVRVEKGLAHNRRCAVYQRSALAGKRLGLHQTQIGREIRQFPKKLDDRSPQIR